MKEKPKTKYWEPRPGFNYHTGFPDPVQTSVKGGLKEKSIDRSVKDGQSLNK